MEDKNLTLEQEAQIKEKAAALKAEKKTRKVYPMVVFPMSRGAIAAT